MLKPMLARGELRLIGATTLDEYRENIERIRHWNAVSNRCSWASRAWKTPSPSCVA